MTITGFLIAYSTIKKTDLYIAVNLIVLLIIQIILLVNYLNRINRDLVSFFSAVTGDDSSLKYKKTATSRSFERLYELFDQVSEKIQNLKIENTQRSFYLQYLVENAGIGIMTYTMEGKIDIINPSAKSLLNLAPQKRVQSINDLDPRLRLQINQLRAGEPCLIRLERKHNVLHLSIRASEFKIHEETIRLLTIQNIKNELEENELLSWQKLIRTLTHEIANSIGPINSSIKTIKSFYEKENSGSSSEIQISGSEILADTIRGLNIIDERAQGLLEFVDKFRSLTTVPVLNLSSFSVFDLLKNIERLLVNDILLYKIDLSIEVMPESLRLTADKQLIEQILINLMTNSIQALDLQAHKKIKLTAYADHSGRISVHVADNGKGISEEITDRIFVPFFTTKEKGSGIGLSFSRQIMRLHNGTISFTSVPGIETVFSLGF